MVSGDKQKAAKPRIGKGGGVEHAYASLRRDIVSLTLKPGASLDEVAIAARLGLSRTPVHEAVVRLASESLVVLLPNRGATVAGMEWDQIRDYVEAYGLLQRLTHRWAALRRPAAPREASAAARPGVEAVSAAGKPEAMNESNWRFHALIAAACGNRIIERSFLHVLTLSLRIAHLAYSPDCFASPHEHREHNDRVLHDHREIVQALRGRDPEMADALGRRHADLGRLRIMDSLARDTVGPWDIDLGQVPPGAAGLNR